MSETAGASRSSTAFVPSYGVIVVRVAADGSFMLYIVQSAVAGASFGYHDLVRYAVDVAKHGNKSVPGWVAHEIAGLTAELLGKLKLAVPKHASAKMLDEDEYVELTQTIQQWMQDETDGCASDFEEIAPSDAVFTP